MASPEAFAGYWQRPDADQKAIRDGWYYTGDLATTDDDGDLWVAGRVDDMINSGGENIYPDEIEAALVRCAAVVDVCVVGLPDERWGHAVTAFVVPAQGTDPDTAVAATVAHARAVLPSLKRPKRVIAVEAIPRSGVGKTLRRTLVAGEFEALADV
jgi:2-furoate---CoA ligase